MLSVKVGQPSRVINRFYRSPLFRSRCISCGKNFYLDAIPHIVGHTRIYIGDDVKFFGTIGIMSGRTLDNPTLILGNRVSLGERVGFSVNRQITVEDDVSIGPFCFLADNDGHPRDPEGRLKGLPPPPEEILSIRIGRNVKIGYGSTITKGITIGEHSIIQLKSVVTSDIPPYSIAGGNPARILSRRTD
jgi:acetyltransferase-like isoleucine patch superfamily enzyme